MYTYKRKLKKERTNSKLEETDKKLSKVLWLSLKNMSSYCSFLLVVMIFLCVGKSLKTRNSIQLANKLQSMQAKA